MKKAQAGEPVVDYDRERLSDEARKYAIDGKRVAFVIVADVTGGGAVRDLDIALGYYGPSDLEAPVLAQILSDLVALGGGR